jgi:hypothetical protein
MNDHDYARRESETLRDLKQLEGLRLTRVLVQIVAPEFNCIDLVFEEAAFEVCGQIGSEIIGIKKLPEIPRPSDTGHIQTVDFEPFSIFVGRLIVQARAIGSAWNGHGIELSFEGLPDRTMLIQSIYSGDKPAEYEDCLRLGIGTYWHTWPEPQPILTDVSTKS